MVRKLTAAAVVLIVCVVTGTALAITRTDNVVAAGLDQAVKVNADRIKLQTKDPTDVHLYTFTFADGESTPWHHHPGVGLLAVKTGKITLYESECDGSGRYNSSQYPAGTVFIESGEHLAWKAKATGATEVWVTFVVPDGVPFSRGLTADEATGCPVIT